MDPFSVAGLSLEVLGLGTETIKWIKRTVSKKILITPHEVVSTTKHWDSNSSVIIQNVTDRPLFSIQVVCWYEDGQEVIFKPHHMQKLQTFGPDISLDTAFYIVRGTIAPGKRLYLLEINRLLPSSSIEVDLQIKGRGAVKFLAVHYDEKSGKTILKNTNGVSIPFTVPFSMKLETMSFWMKKGEA